MKIKRLKGNKFYNRIAAAVVAGSTTTSTCTCTCCSNSNNEGSTEVVVVDSAAPEN